MTQFVAKKFVATDEVACIECEMTHDGSRCYIAMNDVIVAIIGVTGALIPISCSKEEQKRLPGVVFVDNMLQVII